MRWQPIDTAPKDGTEVLLAGGVTGIDIGSWCACGAYHSKSKLRPAYFEQAWGSRGSHMLHPQPTHWMPLPDAP